MKVTKCDMCGRIMVAEGESYYFGFAGHRPLKYTGRDEHEHSLTSYDLDLCARCARRVSETIDRMIGTEEQDVQGAD